MDGDTYSVRVFNGAGTLTSLLSTLRVTPGKFTLLAGHVGGVGNVDGSGATAQFNSPAGVAMDSAGNTYVADSGNHTIRKITSTGVVSTIAGQPGTRGKADGAGTSAATFSIPRGVAVDDLGNIYVADQANNAIRRIDTSGNVLTIAGSGVSGSSNSATGTLATFNRPVGVAVIGTMLYVVDAGNNKIRRVDLDPLGTFTVTDLSGSPTGVAGANNGTLLAATYSNPTGISADVVGQILYVTDAGNALVRKLDLIPVGGAVTTLAGRAGITAGLDGDLATASFRSADGLTYSAAANAVFVSDAASHTVRKVDLAAGSGSQLYVTTFAGSFLNAGVGGGVGALARFNGPQGIAITQAGDRLVVADNTSNLVDQIEVSTRLVANLAGSSVARGSTNGKAADSLFNVPTGLVVDGSNQKLYIADSANHVIRLIDLAKPQTDAGYVSLYAGAAGSTGTTNGTLSAARFNNPRALALGAGALYVAEVGNNSIRKIDMALGQVTKVPDPGAVLNNPGGIAVDAADKIYVASTFNHNIYLMSGGTVTLIAGNGLPGLADGNGAAAQFSSPVGLALDEANHLLYVADRGNCAIRTIDVLDPNYAVLTLAGGVGCGFNDTGASPAQFALPLQIALDGTATVGQRGGIYVTDLANHAVRKITTSALGVATVTTVVGSPARIGAQLGSNDPGISGLNAPYGVAVDAPGRRLYLSDDVEHAIMRISPLP
jgi:sugar lactone lactonase YvrE